MNRPLEIPRVSIDLSREADLSIGTLQVCPSHRQAIARGQRETIQPRVMQVLVALARADGAVLSREDLIESCWDGITVGDDAINRCIAKVRQIAELGGERHFEIETIPRVGYRLAHIDPKAQAVPNADGSNVNHAGQPGAAPSILKWITRRASYVAAAIAIVGLVGISLAWVFRSPPHQAPAAHRDPLLAVMPFRNLNAGAASRYFSDGVTEEIIDAVLQVTDIRVAAPASSFALRNKGAPNFARTLAATHVLSGSVERDRGDLRVVAQLADMSRNRVIWSRIYHTTVAQTPALQHHIAVKIANSLDMRLSSRSLNEAIGIDPKAYDHYLRGRDLFRQRHDISVAAKELEKSVRLAPRFAKAWSTLAAVRYLRGAGHLQNREDFGPMFEKARAAAHRALALDPANGEALGILAVTLQGNRLATDSLFERALRAEPNNTQLLNWHHNFLYSVGRYREAGDEIERAYELDRLTPAIVYNAALDSVARGNLARAKQIIELDGRGVEDMCSEEDSFEVRAEYLLSAHNWKMLSQHLNALPTRFGPQLAAFYRLGAETAIALDRRESGEFAGLRARWRAAATGDRFYNVIFLTLLGDPKGALEVVDAALASGAPLESSLLFIPGLQPLRRDPMAKALMIKWNFFQYWRASNHWPDFCDEPGLPFNCRAEASRLAQAR